MAGSGIAGGNGTTPSLQHIEIRKTVSVLPSFSLFSGVTTMNTSVKFKESVVVGKGGGGGEREIEREKRSYD